MGVIKLLGLTVVAVFTSAACTKTVNTCSVDSDCKDIAYPFCDVTGQYGPSGGKKNVCTIVPPDCPVDRCGCSPGATTCSGGTLSVCNLDRSGTTQTTCPLGCAGSMDRCLTFTPLNGLDSALTASANEPAISLLTPVTFDTDAGTVKNQNGVSIQMKSIVILQPDSPGITAFLAQSIDISGANVIGSRAFAMVSTGKINLRGVIDVSANRAVGGPGGKDVGPSVGLATISGGGGGNGTDGAYGATDSFQNDSIGGAGGKAANLFEPLQGGGRGGGTASGPGGGGGGGIQIVSGSEIVGETLAMIDAGGGGAVTNANGGGAGGTVILEAPQVSIYGAVVANGAAGSACNVAAADGTRTTEPAAGTRCGTLATAITSGSGGTRDIMPSYGRAPSSGAAGGGGAVGRLLVRTADGNYLIGDGSLISASVVTQQLLVH